MVGELNAEFPIENSWCWDGPILKIKLLELDIPICHLIDQEWSESRLDWKLENEFLSEITVNSFKSSANSSVVHVVGSNRSTISLIKMLKRTCPRTLPCGTPLVIEHVEEMDEPTRTAWVLWVKNAFIHNKRLPDIPYASSLWSSLLCEIESKALWKSTYAIVTDLWLASVMVQLFLLWKCW